MTLWYLARGAGLAALALLTVTTALGALGTDRGRPDHRVLLQYAHRATATLGLAVLTLHVTTILADQYAGVGWLGALVPLESGYRPVWVGFGTIAVYAFVAVAALGFARGRMATSQRGARIWRALHGLAYVAWLSAMLHGVNAGSDTSVTWVRLLYVGCGLAVLTAVIARVSTGAKPMTTARVLAGASR